ncbi:MAG: type 4a pilus biogenesis protein PilO [Gemmatimonadales bacterium]
MAITAKERQQLLGVAIVAAIGGGIAFWMYWRADSIQQQQDLRLRNDSLQAVVDSARSDLARGTVESIRQQVRDYEATLQRMSLLVPTGGSEVATLIDNISDRAKKNGVKVGEFNPLAVESGVSFDVHRYRWTVYGYYDDIGVLMSDIASLPRIMVPYDVSLTLASVVNQRTLGDTTGAAVEARFQLRTYVKRQSQPAQGGQGGG